MDHNVDLNDMRIFCVVAKAKGITAASKELKITKQSLSRKISLYEEQLGVMLIARNTRHFELTQAGNEFFSECCEIIGNATRALEKVQSFRTDKRGTLKIHLPEIFHCSIFIRMISQFIAKNPLVKIQIISCPTRDCIIKNSLDIQFRIGKLDDSSFIARSLGLMDFIHVAPGSGKADANFFEKSDFINILNFDSEFFKMPVTVDNALTHVDNFNMCKEFILEGRGHSIMPFSWCEKELLDGSMRHVDVDWHGEQEINLVYLKNKFIHPHLKTFIDFFVEQSEMCSLWKVRKMRRLASVNSGKSLYLMENTN